MKIHKIKKKMKIHKKKLFTLADKYFTNALFKNIKPVNISNSEYIFIFNQVKSSFAEKLYLLLAHGFAERGIASCFLYKKDLLKPYSPKFSIDGWEISNSFTAEEKRFVKSKRGEPLFLNGLPKSKIKKLKLKGSIFFI
jgi:hypothetical protein